MLAKLVFKTYALYDGSLVVSMRLSSSLAVAEPAPKASSVTASELIDKKWVDNWHEKHSIRLASSGYTPGANLPSYGEDLELMRSLLRSNARGTDYSNYTPFYSSSFGRKLYASKDHKGPANSHQLLYQSIFDGSVKNPQLGRPKGLFNLNGDCWINGPVQILLNLYSDRKDFIGLIDNMDDEEMKKSFLQVYESTSPDSPNPVGNTNNLRELLGGGDFDGGVPDARPIMEVIFSKIPNLRKSARMIPYIPKDEWNRTGINKVSNAHKREGGVQGYGLHLRTEMSLMLAPSSIDFFREEGDKNSAEYFEEQISKDLRLTEDGLKKPPTFLFVFTRFESTGVPEFEMTRELKITVGESKERYELIAIQMATGKHTWANIRQVQEGVEVWYSVNDEFSDLLIPCPDLNRRTPLLVYRMMPQSN